MAGSHNVSFDDRNLEVLKYEGFWFHEGTWNASSVGQTGTLTSSNDLNANVTFTFPKAAVAFFYYGIKRSRGGSYGICVDCDPNARHFENIDAVNASDDGKNPPVVLYSKRFEMPGVHEIILRNQPDTRFPNDNSQITIDRFEIEVIDPTAPTSSSSTPTPISATSAPSTSSPTSAAGALFQTQAPVGAIVGGVIGGLTILLVALSLWFWCWRRKQKARRDLVDNTPPDPVLPDPVLPDPVLVEARPQSREMSGSYSTLVRPTVYSQKTKGYNASSSHRSRPSESSSEWTLATSSSGRRTRREVDAGPVEGSEVEMLPPEYEQVFQRGGERSERGRHLVTMNENNGGNVNVPPVPPKS